MYKMTHRCCYCINVVAVVIVVVVVVALKMLWVVMIIMQPKFLLKKNKQCLLKYANKTMVGIHNYIEVRVLIC